MRALAHICQLRLPDGSNRDPASAERSSGPVKWHVARVGFSAESASSGDSDHRVTVRGNLQRATACGPPTDSTSTDRLALTTVNDDITVQAAP